MKKRGKQILILSIVLIIVLGLLGFGYYRYDLYQKKLKKEEELKFLEIKKQKEISNMREVYNKYVITTKDSLIYKKDGKKYIKTGNISKDIVLELKEIEIDNYEELYFKLNNLEYYIRYDEIEKTENYNEKFNDLRYRNYIPFDENLELETSTLYLDENKKYEINDKISLPIIIKETDKYYIEYDKKLLYYKKTDNDKIVSNVNSTAEKSEHFAIINYHYIVGEGDNSCTTSLCTPIKDFDSHLNYLKENGYFAVSMKEVEWFIDGKINLPKKSLGITIDDGWYASNAIGVLQKYQTKATLFLIGEIYDTKFDKNQYISDYLDVHSHGWDLHEPGVCSTGRGGAILCLDHNELVNDLKKSSEWLNNTTVFCYPFYEYNDHAINALKEAGYTIALAGGGNDVYKGIDKYKVPRYGLSSYTTINDIARIVSY